MLGNNIFKEEFNQKVYKPFPLVYVLENVLFIGLLTAHSN